MISNLCTSGDHIIVRKYTIQKCYFYPGNHIFHCNLKCLTFCLPHRLPELPESYIFIRNLMWTVSKITRCTSVCIFNYQSHTSVIPGSITHGYPEEVHPSNRFCHFRHHTDCLKILCHNMSEDNPYIFHLFSFHNTDEEGIQNGLPASDMLYFLSVL